MQAASDPSEPHGSEIGVGDVGHPMARAILAKWPSAQFLSRGAVEELLRESEQERTERVRREAYAQRELARKTHPKAWSAFKTWGPALVRAGIFVFPQERRNDERKPGTVGGRPIAYKNDYLGRLPHVDEAKFWARQCPDLNVALNTGGAGTWQRVLPCDIDIDDPLMAQAVTAIAFKHLGRTPFIRHAGGPRRVLFYRTPPDDPIEQKRTFQLLDRNGEKLKDAAGNEINPAIEIMGIGSPITLLGLHHKTLRPFEWPEASPLTDSPELMPVVTKAMVQAFIDAVDELVTPVKNPSLNAWSAISYGAVEADAVEGDIVVPGGSGAVADAIYGADGRVTDHSESFLRSRSFQYCLRNKAHCLSEEGRLRLADRLFDEARKMLILPSRKYPTEQALRNDTRTKINSSARKVREGNYRERAILRDENGVASSTAVSRIVVERDRTQDDLSFMTKVEKRKPIRFTSRTERCAEKAAARALKRDRRAETKALADRLNGLLHSWMDEAFRLGRLEDVNTAVRVVQAVAGSGKTTRVIRLIGKFIAQRGRLGRAIAMFLPSYPNIEEGIARAGQEGATEFFRAEAGEIRRAAAKAGMRVMIYAGKKRAGCKMEEELEALTKARIGTHGLCEARVDDGYSDEKVPKKCRYYGTCPVIAQRDEAANADLIILPHAFLTIELPKQVKKAIGPIIIDERCWPEMIRSATFPLDALKRARQLPRLTKKDLAEGQTAEGLQADREAAARIVLDAFKRGVCPAAALHAARRNKHGGRDWVESAIAILDRTHDMARRVYPGITKAELEALTEKPTGEYHFEEARFWRIVRDRIDAISAGQALGERDQCIQLLDGATVRISWAKDITLPGRPTLLLDASADDLITRACWTPREVKVDRIDASQHLRIVWIPDSTYSNTSFAVELAEDTNEKKRRAERIHKVRSAISNLGALYGHGHVIVGMSLGPRIEVQMGAWVEPENCDMVHFGNLRGLNFAEHHMAAVSIGRMELSARVIDGLVAGIASRLGMIEAPIDALGTNLKANGKQLGDVGRQVTQFRDGSDLIMGVPRWKGDLAARVQKQYREEELRQFAGRLRPVHRDGNQDPPVLFVFGRIVPDDWIVDELGDIDSIANPEGYGNTGELLNRLGTSDVELADGRASDLIDRAGMKQLMERNGLVGADLSSRAAKGMIALAVKLEGRPERVIQVPAYLEDPKGHVAAMARDIGHKVETIRIVAEGATRIPRAGPKPLDRVDRTLGTREERLANAERIREEVLSGQEGDVPRRTEPACPICGRARPAQGRHRPNPGQDHTGAACTGSRAAAAAEADRCGEAGLALAVRYP